jgi:predicted Zn-dependent protease
MHGTWRNYSRTILPCALLGAVFLLVGCSTGGRNSISYLLAQEKAQIRSKIARNIGSSPQELQRAFDSSRETENLTAAEITARVVSRLGQSDDKSMQAHLQTVVKRLVGPLNSHNIDYKVILVKEQKINAFTPGGGIIVVHEGLLMHCDTEGQIAAVLAHEIAHIIRRHPLRQRQYIIARKAGRSIADAITPDPVEDTIGKMLKVGGGATINAAVRAQEKEADSIAIDIMVAAGYAPAEMIRVQRVFMQYAPQSSRLANAIYGTHPLSKDRVDAAKLKIAEVYPGVRGDVSTAKFEKLIRIYYERRMKSIAAKL